MYSQLLPLIFFSVAAAFTPGPNNIIGSYSGFNFGIKKSIPLILGVTFGYTILISLVAGGLNIVFNAYPGIFIFLYCSQIIYNLLKVLFFSIDNSIS